MPKNVKPAMDPFNPMFIPRAYGFRALNAARVDPVAEPRTAAESSGEVSSGIKCESCEEGGRGFGLA